VVHHASCAAQEPSKPKELPFGDVQNVPKEPISQCQVRQLAWNVIQGHIIGILEEALACPASLANIRQYLLLRNASVAALVPTRRIPDRQVAKCATVGHTNPRPARAGLTARHALAVSIRISSQRRLVLRANPESTRLASAQRGARRFRLSTALACPTALL
jgi:hypothetical protein